MQGVCLVDTFVIALEEVVVVHGEEVTKLVTADGEVHAVVGAAELIYVVEVS